MASLRQNEKSGADGSEKNADMKEKETGRMNSNANPKSFREALVGVQCTNEEEGSLKMRQLKDNAFFIFFVLLTSKIKFINAPISELGKS